MAGATLPDPAHTVAGPYNRHRELGWNAGETRCSARRQQWRIGNWPVEYSLMQTRNLLTKNNALCASTDGVGGRENCGPVSANCKPLKHTVTVYYTRQWQLMVSFTALKPGKQVPFHHIWQQSHVLLHGTKCHAAWTSADDSLRFDSALLLLLSKRRLIA